MRPILCKTFAIALIAAARLAPAQPQGLVTPAEILEVVDLNFDPQTSRVTFGVVNKSLKPVLAFSLKVTSVFADGTTESGDYDFDYTSGLSLVGRKIIAPPGYHVGELRTGERSNDCRIGARTRRAERPVSVTVFPTLVVFADNSVAGDNEKRANLIFQDRRESRDAYAEQLELLRGYEMSPGIEARLRELLGNLKQAAKGRGNPGRYFAYQDLDRGLEMTLQKCIAPKKRTPKDCLELLIQDVKSRYSAFAEHAERVGGIK